MSEDISLKAVFLKILAGITLVGGILFFTAATFTWPQAWVYTVFYAAWALGTVPWLKKHNPELLRKRLLVALKAKALWDRLFIELNLTLYVAILATSAADWSRDRPVVPVWLNISAFAGLLAGYALILYAFKANKYAVKTVEAQPGQRVVGSGPYAVVRHPMYAGVGLFYVSTPPALGSYYGLVPSALAVFGLLLRAHLEEKILMRDLPGYAGYVKKVRYRIIPGVW